MSPTIRDRMGAATGAAVISWVPFAIFTGAAAPGLHRAALVGRPTAYSGLALGVAGLALGTGASPGTTGGKAAEPRVTASDRRRQPEYRRARGHDAR
jgi:hypothetical protein